MKEISFYECWGSVQDPCPYNEKDRLVNSNGQFVGERVRIMGSSSCTCCQFYAGRSDYFKKWGTGHICKLKCTRDELKA